MIPGVRMTRPHFVQFAYKTNRICKTPSQNDAVAVASVPSAPFRWIRIRICNSRTNWKSSNSYRIEFVYTNSSSSIRISSSPKFVYEFNEFRWIRIRILDFVYTNFVSKPIRRRNFVSWRTKWARDEFRIRNFVYELTLGDEISFNSYTKFLLIFNSLAKFRRGGVTF